MIFLFVQCIRVIYCLCSTDVCKSAFGKAVLNHYAVAVYFGAPHSKVLPRFLVFAKVNKDDVFVCCWWIISESEQ